MELNIEKFSPTKADLTQLAEQSKVLSINGVEDKQGYALVHEARMKLKNARVEITKVGKALRADALSFQRAVIEKEKELIAIIEPVEIELETKQNEIDKEKEMIKRQAILPERQAKLAEIDVVMQDAFILVMDDNQFQEFLNIKKTEFLEEKERQIKAERDKIEADKIRLAEEKRIEDARKEAEKEATEKAIRDAELAKKQAEIDKVNALKEAADKAEKDKQEALEKAEKEKQVIIDEQNRKEKARLEAERIKAEEEEDRKKAEKENQEKLEKRKKYQNFLTKNGLTDKSLPIIVTLESKDEFFINKVGNEFILYKKVASIII